MTSDFKFPLWTMSGSRRLLAVVLGMGFFGLAGAPQASAQWRNESYTLKGGWNAIYLHGAATHATIDALFPNVAVQEVWRWNPNPDQLGFITNPQQPASGTPEWSVWVRGTTSNTLTQMTGQAAYLVKCAGTSSNSYTVSMLQRPLPPNATWVRHGANLLGFPTRQNSTFPTFANYFTAFPAAIATGTKIFRYTGGGLGASNPLRLFSPTLDRVDRNQAYWFDAEVVGNFYAPIQINLSQVDGMHFGRTGTVMTARVFNRTSTAITVTITPTASAGAPNGQDNITTSVPVTRRTFDPSTASWVESAISGPYAEVIPAQSSVELSFGINRSAMTGGTDAFYASLLRFTDAGNLFDIYIPVSARQTSLAGLWVGEAMVTAVESKAQADAITPSGRAYPLRYLLHVSDDGTARILSQVFTGPQAASPYNFGICTKEAGLKADSKADATRIVAAHLPLDRVLGSSAGSGSVAIPGTLSRTLSIPFNDPTNPFVHQYHPDHDNKSAKGAPLAAGMESYNIERQVTFTFTATPPTGSTVTTGWGSNVIGGTYAEVIQGLHKDSTGVGTGNGLRLTGTFELRRASEIGVISITP